MKIALGTDHRGANLGRALVRHLEDTGHTVEVVSELTDEPSDYPDVSYGVARAVADGAAERGVLICGTGIGACIAANKVTGARAALRVEASGEAGRMAVGLEAQRGIRRWSGARVPRRAGARQGGWVEWTSQVERMTVGLRQELWGERGFATAVRRVSGVHVELEGPVRTRLRVAHTVFRTGFGQNLYVREIYSDRLVLRALTGHGQRTRIAVRLPAAGGTLDASIDLTQRRTGLPRAIWTLDWSRRARTRR